jgi:hypothetical protein
MIRRHGEAPITVFIKFTCVFTPWLSSMGEGKGDEGAGSHGSEATVALVMHAKRAPTTCIELSSSPHVHNHARSR